MAKLDMEPYYLSSENYAKFAVEQIAESEALYRGIGPQAGLTLDLLPPAACAGSARG